MWLYHPLCLWSPLQLAGRWGKQKRRESLKRFSLGSHPKVAHITFLPMDLNSPSYTAPQTSWGKRSSCVPRRQGSRVLVNAQQCLPLGASQSQAALVWSEALVYLPGEWGIILMPTVLALQTNSCDQNLSYCLEFIEQVAKMQGQLFGILTTTAQEGENGLGFSILPPPLYSVHSDWVGVLGFLLLTWFVDSSRRTLWWCGSNQITPFALAGGLLYRCFHGKAYWQQGPLSTGKDAKGFPLIFSTMVRLCELKHS